MCKWPIAQIMSIAACMDVCHISVAYVSYSKGEHIESNTAVNVQIHTSQDDVTDRWSSCDTSSKSRVIGLRRQQETCLEIRDMSVDAPDNRSVSMCNGRCTEDVWHILLNCPAYILLQRLRASMYVLSSATANSYNHSECAVMFGIYVRLW
jgi:hypothetical protein